MDANDKADLEGEMGAQTHKKKKKKAMHSINPDVQFTTETAEDYEQRRVPTLDTYVWIDEMGVVRHSYFQ